MRKIFNLSIAIIFASALRAQATLPTSWDMGNASSPITSPPTGWSYLNSNSSTPIYTASGFYNSTPQSIKLDATGEYLLCEFVDKPSTTSFYVRHTGSTGAFTGVFDVLESANGTSWTTVKNYTSDLPGALTLVTLNLNPTTRYVKWILSTKTSGFNIAIDDAIINKAVGGANREIAVINQANNKRIIKNENLFLGNTASNAIKIKNLSTSSSLTIDSIIISGTDKSYFGLSAIPATVIARDSASFSINLLSSAILGTKIANISIYSNDQEGNEVMSFNVEAINGTLSTEPSNHASSLIFTSIKAWRLKASFNQSDAQSYLVLMNKSAIMDMPVDNTSYQKGAYIGTSRIMHVGAAQEIELDKIEANTAYYLTVFAFNGINGFENYKTTGAPFINTSTPGINAGTYYSTIDANKPSFVSDLRSKLNNHFQVYYSNYAPYIVDNFEAYDTTNNKKVLTCYYSGFKHIYSSPLIWTVLSREHAYPYSYMGQTSKDSANYSDLHILLPVHQDNANSIRSNFPFGNVKSATYQFLGGKVGTDSVGTVVYEPLELAKGLVARANFYICAAYHSNATKFTIPTANQFLNQNQDQWILKKWHQQYPPSNREIARHEYIASVQNNRNPFIDNPDWACKIDFSNMTYLAAGDCKLPNKSVNQIKTLSLNIWPNPARLSFEINTSNFISSNLDLTIFDITGSSVYLQTLDSKRSIINPKLTAGTYLILVKSATEIAIEKIVIE